MPCLHHIMSLHSVPCYACVAAVAQKLLKDKCPTCDVKNLPNSGPAPVLARLADFRAATPLWEELSLWIETHEDAKKQLGAHIMAPEGCSTLCESTRKRARHAANHCCLVSLLRWDSQLICRFALAPLKPCLCVHRHSRPCRFACRMGTRNGEAC